MDTFTSLLAGLTVFAILGGLAAELGAEISEVAKSGPGLIFVSYADAIAKFEWAPQVSCSLHDTVSSVQCQLQLKTKLLNHLPFLVLHSYLQFYFS